MTEITLVLPFALPPPELAPDLIRALQTPALASLLSRTSARHPLPVNDSVHALPYEAWVARATGVSSSGRPAFATRVMHAHGLHAPAEGTWFIVNPVHIAISRSHLLMHDPRGLHLSDAHSRALFEAAQPFFADSAKPLHYGDAGTWFMRADDWADLNTATPDAALGLNLTDWLPTGERAVDYRKLQNEVQMLWFGHPVNTQREAEGLAAVNGFWPWAQAAPGHERGAVKLAASGAPAWLAALAGADATFAGLVDAGQDALLVCCELTGAALAAEWSAWLAAMQHLEQTVFTPALGAVKAGRIKGLRLLLSDRARQLELSTSSLAQRAFWRRPTLNTLLP